MLQALPDVGAPPRAFLKASVAPQFATFSLEGLSHSSLIDQN
jgi:hypothetical protein